jgi:NADP-dependent 3-hydroxy acid dehydrogenase YdfG
LILGLIHFPTDSLADLVAVHSAAILPLKLDVTDKAAAFEAVKRAHEHFVRLDVVVNNAGSDCSARSRS